MGVRNLSTYSETLTRPVMVRISNNLIVAKFYVMKIVPAKHILDLAIKNGSLDRSWTVVDTTSGTFGLGMAIACAEVGINFRIFSDPVIDKALKRRIELLGGEVIIVGGEDTRSPQQARLDALHEYLDLNPKSYWLRQYDNPQVLDSYAGTGDEIRAACGRPIKLVASVGSGGSSCGIAARLRSTNNETQLIGVDTFGSVLFGLENGLRNLRGMGNSILPGNLDHRAFDEVHWIDGELAARGARQLLAKIGLFAGPSTGAAYLVAKHLAAESPDSDVVFVAPDAGYRYQDILLCPELRKSDVLQILEEPLKVPDLAAVNGPWARMFWHRRSLSEVRSQ